MAMSAEPGRKTAYSADFRWRVVWQRIGMGLTFKKIAENLNIACSTAQATYKLFEQTGGVDPRGQPSRTDVRSLNDTDEIYIVSLVLENPSMYLQEICQEVYNVLGKQVSSPPQELYTHIFVDQGDLPVRGCDIYTSNQMTS